MPYGIFLCFFVVLLKRKKEGKEDFLSLCHGSLYL